MTTVSSFTGSALPLAAIAAFTYLGYSNMSTRSPEKREGPVLENTSLDVLREVLKPAVELFIPKHLEKFQASMISFDRSAKACGQPKARASNLSELLKSRRDLIMCLRDLKGSLKSKPGGAEFVDVLGDIEMCETVIENTLHNASQDFALMLEHRY